MLVHCWRRPGRFLTLLSILPRSMMHAWPAQQRWRRGAMSPASVALLLLLAITAEARTRDQTRSIRQDSTGPDVLSLPWAHGVLKNELNVKHLDESGISLPFAGHGSTMLEPHTVEEEAAVRAARHAVGKARRAERHNALLRKDVETKVDTLEHKVIELKNRMALATRASKAREAAAIADAKQAANPAWHEVPLAQPGPADNALAVALPPGPAAASQLRSRRKRGRGKAMHVHNKLGARVPTGGLLTRIDQEEELPVMPPGGSLKESGVKFSGLAASDAVPRKGAGLPVVEVERDGRWMTIAAQDSSALPPGPDMVIVTLCDGGEQVLPYATNSRVDIGGGGLRLTAAGDVRFPECAAYARPALQARSLVKWVSDSELHADAWTAPPTKDPGFVRAQLASGEVLTLPVSRVEVVGVDDAAAQQLRLIALHAAKGCAFPHDVAYVSPLGGSPWASPYHQGVISAVGASYFRGLQFQVRDLSEDGERIQVQGRGLGGVLDLAGRIIVREGGTCGMASAFYRASELQDSGHAGSLTAVAAATLVAAHGTRFPQHAQQVLLPKNPEVAFSVFWRSEDGSQVRVQAPDNGALHRKGGVVVVTRRNGEQGLYRVASAQPHRADEDGPEGLVLVAEPGVTFPADIVRISQSGPVAPEGQDPLNVEFVDAQGAYSYRVGKDLGVGDRVYVDRDFVYTALPESLVGHTYILTAMGDASSQKRHDFVTLMVDRPADVYILYDARAQEPPQWLSGAFYPVGGAIQTNRGPLALWKTKMMVTGSMTFGGNAAFPAAGKALMYTIVVLPAAAHRPQPPSKRVAAAAMSSMQYPVMMLSPRGDTLTIMARPTGAFQPASEDKPQLLQVQKRDGSIAEVLYVEMQVVDSSEPSSPPLIKFRSSLVMSFPAEAKGASPAAVYHVVFQSPDLTIMRVDCPNSGLFPPGPGHVKIKMAYGRQADFPYASLRATAGGMELRAPEGLAFPPDAVAVAPAATPLADPVVFVSPDAGSIRLLVADSALYFPGPSVLRVVTYGGTFYTGGVQVKRVKYSKVEYVKADVNGPAGLEFTAVEGEAFPEHALCAQALSFPVLSVQPDGMQMEVLVPSGASFPPGPCMVKLKSVDGDSVSIPYTTSARLAAKADGKVHLLLLAQKGKPFPRMPSFAEPSCDLPAYEPYPMRPVLFPILSYSEAKLPGVTTSSVRVQASDGDGFIRAGGYVKVYCSGGEVIKVPYKRARGHRGVMELLLPRGVKLPGDAVQLAPESAPVISLSQDRKMMQIAAPDDGSFLPGPGVIYARVRDGRERRLKYETLAFLHPGGTAGGFILTAPRGRKFPFDVVAVRPAPDETASRPKPSKVVLVKDGGHSITLKPSSSFPVRGIADVSLPDGSIVQVGYGSSHLSASAFSVALPDGTSVTVPPSYVKRVPPQAEVTLPDGTLHTVGLSAVRPSERSPASTQVLVTLPDGEEIKVPETAIEKDKGHVTLLQVMLHDGQHVEVPEKDVLPVHRTYFVKIAGVPAIEVPETRVCPCACEDALEDCKCSCSGEVSTHEDGHADKYQVGLPDGSIVKVLPDDISPGSSGPGPRFKVALPGGRHTTVLATQLRHHVHGVPHGMVEIRLAGGAVQIVPKASLSAAKSEPEQYQVLLPDGIYSLVSADAVTKAAGKVSVKLKNGRQVSVPTSNVHVPLPELRVVLDGNRAVDVPPSDVRFVEAHLQVLLPNGKTVTMAASQVSEVNTADGAPAELILYAVDGASFPADAQYVTPSKIVPLEVTSSSPDLRRLVVVAPPDSLPNVVSRVRVIQANGKTRDVNYESAHVLAGQATGPFMPVQRVSDDGSWIEVSAPAALPPGPGMLRAALKDGKHVDVVFSAIQSGDAGLLRLLSRSGSSFPVDIVQVAAEGPRKVLLTARIGEEFPPRSVGVVPLLDVQTSFPVVEVTCQDKHELTSTSCTGARMRVDAPDDGTFFPGPGILRVRLRGGMQMLVAYDSVAVCMPDIVGPEGLIFTAPAGVAFPFDAEMVQATASFRSSDNNGAADEELLAEVITDAESQEVLGPPCLVTMESKDGSEIQVAPYGLFSDSGGLVDVKTVDGSVIRVRYGGVKRKEAAGYVTAQMLIAIHGSRFPARAVSVQPVGKQKLPVGTLRAGSELYSDDPAHQFTFVPDELRGGKLILTDNAARGSTQGNQLCFTVWGWNRVYVLRPDAKCDISKVPVQCTYQTADVPRWFANNFRPRPDLYVTTTDGSMAVFESVHPVQGPVMLGGNADIPAERLLLSVVTTKTGHVYEVVNATPSVSIYDDQMETLKDLPEELLGEPMVQTSTVDQNFTGADYMTVTLSAAADCYVLRDDSEGHVPAWLSENFVELPGLRIATNKDHSMSVWQSRLPLFGQVHFGGNEGGASMYAVICVQIPFHESTMLTEVRVGISELKVQPDPAQGEFGIEIAALEQDQAIEQLYVSQTIYVDTQNIRVLRVSAQLQGATLVRTARAEKERRDGDVMSFVVSQPSDIYIVRDDMPPAHAWLPVAAVAYPGDAASPPSPVIFVSADGSKIRVRADSPFPPGPAVVTVRDREGREFQVDYTEAADAVSAWLDGVLLPGGLQIVAKHGSFFPADSVSVIPADAVVSDVTEMAVIASGDAFPTDSGLAVVRTRDGQETTVKFASSKQVDMPFGGESRVILKAPHGENFPANIASVRPVTGSRDALPQWLAAGFSLTEMLVQTSRGAMHVYKSRLPVDGRVVLGGNAALPAQGSLWGNYVVVVLPAGHDQSHGAGPYPGSFPLDNYVVVAKPEAAADFSPGAPGLLAVGAASAFSHGAVQQHPKAQSALAPTQDDDETQAIMPAQYSVVGMSRQGSRLLVQVQGVDGSFPPASPIAPQRLDVMQATGAVAEVAYVNVEMDLESQSKEPMQRFPVLAFDAPEGSRFPPNAVAASPAATFLVVSVDLVGDKIRVASSGAGMLSASAVKVRTKDGLETQIPVKDVHMEGGLLVIESRPPSVFPRDSALVGPAATPPPVAAWTSAQRRFPVFDISNDAQQLVVEVNTEADVFPGPDTVVIETQNGGKVSVAYETAALLPRRASGALLVQLTTPNGHKFPKSAQYCVPERSGSRTVLPASSDRKPAEYLVLDVEDSKMVVRARADGTFPPGPARVRVTVPSQGPLLVPYSSVYPYRDGKGPAKIILVAGEGFEFPSGAFSVNPEFEPVISIRHDGYQMQVKAPDDGSFPPGPAVLRLQLGDGSIMTTKYAASARLFSGSAAGGLLLTAVPGSPFPLDATSAAPEEPREFRVCEAAADGFEIRVSAPNDGCFQPAPASVSLILVGIDGIKRRKLVKYEGLTVVPASGECPDGLLLHGNFGREIAPAVVAVLPVGLHNNRYGPLLHQVKCKGLAVCRTGVLNAGSVLHADDLGAQVVSLPKILQGLEYIRTPASPFGLHGQGVVSMALSYAADVYTLVPEISGGDLQNAADSSWFPILRVFKDSTEKSTKVYDDSTNIVAVVPRKIGVPGAAFPAAPWVVKIKSSDGGVSTYRYHAVRRLENDDIDKGVAVGRERGRIRTTAELDLESNMLVELSLYCEEGPIPHTAFSISPVPAFEPPEWMSRQFVLTDMTVSTTSRTMMVWKSKMPMIGRISLEGLLDTPALRPVTVSNVKSMGPASYRVTTLAPNTHLYVDNPAVVSEVPAALSSMSLIQTAVADAQYTGVNFLRFTVDEPSYVYVLSSEWGGQVPTWLTTGFERTQMSCDTSIGRLSIWRSVAAIDGEVELGGNFGGAMMYAVVVVPEARSQLPISENYVVAVHGEPAFDPIGLRPAFAEAHVPAAESTGFPTAKDLAVYPVVYVDETSVIVQCDNDAPFPPAPGRMELVLQGGQTVEVDYSMKAPANQQLYAVFRGPDISPLLPSARSELVVKAPFDIESNHPWYADRKNGRVLPQGSGTVTVELADGTHVDIPYSKFERLPSIYHRNLVLVVAAPGYAFPAGAIRVAPTAAGLMFTGPKGQKFPHDAVLAAPSPQFQVTVPDDGTFAQGPSELRLEQSDKTQISLPYSLMFPVAATDTEPSGLIFVSRPGESFPAHTLLVGPAAGPALRISNMLPTGYRVGTIGVGKRMYIDSNETFVDVPDALLGSVYIESSEADSVEASQQFLTFDVNAPAFVVLLVESPKKKISWAPFWFPEFLGGASSTEKLPTWMTQDFKHTELEVLSSSTRYEVLVSKKRMHGRIVLGGNQAAPSTGGRKMYDVLVCRRNVTTFGNRQLFHPGLDSIMTEGWAGQSNDLAAYSWFPILSVEGLTLTVKAVSGAFKAGVGQVRMHGADGTDAVMTYVGSQSFEGSEDQIFYNLTLEHPPPLSASYVRPTEKLPEYVWPVRTVYPGNERMIINAPPTAFPQPPAVLSLIIPGNEDRKRVAYKGVKSEAGGTAALIIAADGETFDPRASFTSVADPNEDVVPHVTDIKVTPESPQPYTPDGSPIRVSSLQYDVSTVGVGKRLWVDESEIMTQVPYTLTGDEFIMTANQDKDLKHPGQETRYDTGYCALDFHVSRPASVLIASPKHRKPLPKWLGKISKQWTDPHTGRQGVLTGDRGSTMLIFQVQLHRFPMPGRVCLGGMSAIPLPVKPKHNYVVIIHSLESERKFLNGPLSWDGTPLALKVGRLPNRWFPITSRSEDGSKIQISAKGLQDGFTAPLNRETGSFNSNVHSMLLQTHASSDLNDDDVGLVMIKSCDSAEAPYTVLRIKPVSANANLGYGAGLEISVGPGLAFPSCVSYARPYFVSIDGPPSKAFAPLASKPEQLKSGHLEFSSTRTFVPIGSRIARVPVERLGGSMGPVSVRYVTSDGTARKSMDYKESNGWLIWKGGEEGTKVIEVPLTAHAPSPQTSGDFFRFFTIQLSDPSGGASIGSPSIISVQIDSRGPVDAYRLPPNAGQASADKFSLETTAAEIWKYPVIHVTKDGKFMKIIASEHSPFAPEGAMKLECLDGKQEMLVYTSIAPASPVEMKVVGISHEGYVIAVSADTASVPRGPGLMNVRDEDGNVAKVVYNTAVQSEGSRVVVRAPAGFPFPAGAVWAWVDSTFLLGAPADIPFPDFVSQAPVTECSVTPWPLAVPSGPTFPVTYVSSDGKALRMEAPPDSSFPPSGSIAFLQPDDTEKKLRYGAVEVVPPARYRVSFQAQSGESIVIEALPVVGHEISLGTIGDRRRVNIPAFPKGPGQVILSFGAKKNRVLVNYAYAARDNDKAILFAPPNAPFPTKISSVELPTTGLLFSRVVGLEEPTHTAFDFPSEPVSALLGRAADDGMRKERILSDGRRAKWFPLVDMAADGSHLRIQAPANAISSGQGMVRLQTPSGVVEDVAFASATVESALPFRVYAIDSNSSECLLRVHRYAFPPGPGALLVTRSGKPDITIKYESATALSVDPELLRVSAEGLEKFPADTISVTPTVGLVRLQAMVGNSFPVSVRNATSLPVAAGLARFLDSGAEADAFYVVGASSAGPVLHVSAPMNAPFPPAGVLSIEKNNGDVVRFPYDRVLEAPEVQFRIAAPRGEDSRHFQVETGGFALPPHGMLAAFLPGQESKLVAYEVVRPVPDNPSGEGWVEVTLVQGEALPTDALKVSMHPRGLLFQTPDGSSLGDTVSHLALASHSVAIAKAWPAGLGPVRSPVTEQEEGGATLRIEAPPAQRAWSEGNQWGVLLSRHDGSQMVWPYALLLPVQESIFPVTSVESDGSAATLTTKAISLPDAPCALEVTTRLGFSRRVHILAVQYVRNGVVTMRAVPGHLWPLDAITASPAGGLEFVAYPHLPFPAGLVRHKAVAETWSQPIPPHLAKFSVVGVSGGGLNMTVAVPAHVHAFMGQADGRLDLELYTEDGGSSIQQVTYAGTAAREPCSFRVAWVTADGGILTVLPSQDMAFPVGQGTVTVFDESGKRSQVRVSQAARARGAVVDITAASDNMFPRNAKHVAFDCLVLTAKPANPFPLLAANGPVSDSWVSPPAAESERPIGQRSSQAEPEEASSVVDDATAVSALNGGAFPFQYTITHVPPDGKWVDVFVPEGLPEPELLSAFELICGIGQRQPGRVRTSAERLVTNKRVSLTLHNIAPDGADMILAVARDTAFPAGPGLLQLTLTDGSSVVAPYEGAVSASEEHTQRLLQSHTDSNFIAHRRHVRSVAHHVLVLAPSGIPFSTSAVSVKLLGETVRLFVAAGNSIPSGATGCMARPVESRSSGTGTTTPSFSQSLLHVHWRAEHAMEQTTGKSTASSSPFLKPHPAVTALQCASSLQYTVGTFGEGRRAYVDLISTWRQVPPALLGRPVIMTAVRDAESSGPWISMFLDEPSDVYVLLPGASKSSTKHAAKGSASSLSALSWLPFKLPSLLGGHVKKDKKTEEDIPSWMVREEYELVPGWSAELSNGLSFDVWRKKVPVLGFLELNGNEASFKGAKRSMYVVVLVPAVWDVNETAVDSWQLPVGFPGKSHPGSMLAVGLEHEGRSSRVARGTRGRILARDAEADALGSGEKDRMKSRGRHRIMKALAMLHRRLARKSGSMAPPRARAALLKTRLERLQRRESIRHHHGKDTSVPQGISASALNKMVAKCGGDQEAGHCLVRAQACMSARSIVDPANCQCFTDAVDGAAQMVTQGGVSAVCTVPCMSAVREAYNGHVKRVTGRDSPCI